MALNGRSICLLWFTAGRKRRHRRGRGWITPGAGASRWGGGHRGRRHVRAVPRLVVAAAAPVSSRLCHPGFASFGVAVLFESRSANSWRSGSTCASACSRGASTVAAAGPRQYVGHSGTVPSRFAT